MKRVWRITVDFEVAGITPDDVSTDYTESLQYLSDKLGFNDSRITTLDMIGDINDFEEEDDEPDS